MRNEPNLKADKWRASRTDLPETPRGVNYGWFKARFRGENLRIMSSGSDSTTGWEHVSVSLSYRIPTWDEMVFVKSLFWRDDETVVQFHPKKSVYKNQMPYCLHLWKKIGEEYELPPDECV